MLRTAGKGWQLLKKWINFIFVYNDLEEWDVAVFLLSFLRQTLAKGGMGWFMAGSHASVTYNIEVTLQAIGGKIAQGARKSCYRRVHHALSPGC